MVLVCGGIGVRLGPVDKLRDLAGRLSRAEKLGLSAAAAGLVIAVVSALVQGVLAEVFRYDYGAPGTMSILETASYASGAIMLCGLGVLVLGRPDRRRALLGWTERVGWGKMGCAWINQFALGLIAAAILIGTLGVEDPTTDMAGAGVALLLVGLVAQIFARGRL